MIRIGTSMRRTGLYRAAALAVMVGLSAGSVSSAHAADDKKAKTATRVTQTLSQATYKQMEVAQKAFDAKNYKAAEAALDVLKAKIDKLNDYERATLWVQYAAIYRTTDDNKRAIGAYTNVLKQANLPDGLRDNALFALAQTYFLIEDYPKSIKVMDKWFSVVADVQPDAYILYAQAYYQQQKYAQAKAPILKALAIAKERKQEPKENWLGLLRAVFFELKDYKSAIRVMEILAANHPKETYFVQLAGLYGLEGNQHKQAVVMHAAYKGGYLTNAPDVLNLARLYLAEEAPERAVDLITAKMKDKSIPLDAENLQLLAQALAIAKEVDRSIPVLTKLASLTGESKHYNYLGQAYTQTGDWTKAAEAYRAALGGKNVSNPGNLSMQLGTALYNNGKLVEAKQAFANASASETQADAAANWVKFINTELERNAALRARAG